jgi:GT2 family glycosyltransferase
MNKPTLFGMITSKESTAYTRYALNSFFSTTSIESDDIIVLIDNDGSWDDYSYPYVNIVKNNQKQSFAANINQFMKLADENSLDLVVMNNDVVFTEGWRQSLELRDDIICLPSCNQTHVYNDDKGNPILPSTLTLEEYNNRYDMLTYLANHHTNANSDYYERFHTAFYLFRLPRRVYLDVGLVDETFAPCGGEDVDYRIRAALKGYKTLYTNGSYVLHFHGKSTWAGSETAKEIERRNSDYFNNFVKKYNEDCANLFLQIGNNQPIISKYGLELLDSNDFTGVMKKFFAFEEPTASLVPMEDVSAPGLLPYVNSLGTNLVGCELGVCLGFTLRYFLDSTKNIDRVYAIDSYTPYMDHWGQVTQDMVDRWKLGSLEILQIHKDRIQWLYMDSWSAANAIADNELDYIFIDGDHNYAAVARDLRKYYSKVKPGGIFAGHDWNLPTVKAAVEHFRKEWGIDTAIKHVDKNVWFWYKGE